jgi:hypothetical protein
MNLKKYILSLGLVFGSALFTLAGPPSKMTAPSPALRSSEDFAKLNPGDKIALVCKECDTVTVQTVASKEEAMEHCKEGSTVTCPSCKIVAKVVTHGPSGKEGTHTVMKIVNDKGEECMFVAKLPN